jgi:hypothetical protein
MSNMKRWIPAVLLVGFAGAAVVAGAFRSATSVETPPAPAAASDATAVVYYFHGDNRCFTCNKIEQRTTDLVRSAFAAELAEDRLRFEVVNIDQPENRHYRETFDLAFSTVVVERTGEARSFQNLDQVWKLVHAEDDAFETYLVRAIRPMVGS